MNCQDNRGVKMVNIKNKLIDIFSGALLVSLVTFPVWLPASIHNLANRNEIDKIEKVPAVVQKIEDIEDMAGEYFKDDFLTRDEYRSLSNAIFRLDSYDVLHAWINRTTETGVDIGIKLWQVENELPIGHDQHIITVEAVDGNQYQIELYGKDLSESDLVTRTNDVLAELKDYVQTEEYKTFFGPLSPLQRLGTVLYGLVSD